MILNLITLATVKTQLGLAVTTYDAQITAMIPLVSNDVRRILNTNYDCYTPVVYSSGEANLLVSSDIYSIQIDQPLFNMGQVVYGADIPEDTYIQAYNPTTAIYTMSANATDDGIYIYPTLEIAQWPTVSKMIFYKISKQTTNAATTALYQSIRYGNVSKTFAPDEINKKYDYPEIFIRDLGTAFAKVG